MSTAAQDSRPVGPARPTRRRRGRPRGQDSSVVRDAALRAAIDLIAEHGYASTSMAQVAEAAGISPSGLAHHFTSKSALLAAVLDHRDARDPIAAYRDLDGPWAPLDSLADLAAENMEQRQLVALYMSVIGEAVNPEHPAHEWMLRHYDLVRSIVVGAVRDGQRRGVISADAPVGSIARALVALMDGLQVQWLLDPEVDMGAEMRVHVEELKRRWGVTRS